MVFGIGISEVLKKVRDGTDKHFFAVKYRKENGQFGEKENVQRRTPTYSDDTKPKRDWGSIGVEVQGAGKLPLVDEYGQKFDLFICLLVSYNGRLIDHIK